MAVLLDTAEIPPAQRADRLVAAMVNATAPSCVVLEDPDGDVHARMDLWRLGSAVVFRAESSGIRTFRTAGQARQAATPVVALAVQEAGVGRHEQFGPQRLVPAGELLMTDRTAPYDFSWTGHGAAGALEIPMAELGLPVEVIRRAGAGLPGSPLYRLVADHIAGLIRDADLLCLDPAAAGVGAASIELVRALLASAGSDDRHARAAFSDSLLTQVRAYVRRHLLDPDLGAASIAAAHNISVRQLYKLCARADFSLAEWIIGQRLDGARQELARPDRRSVAVIGRRWGFSDPTHFGRRFRAAYGRSPSEWRRIAAEEPTPSR